MAKGDHVHLTCHTCGAPVEAEPTEKTAKAKKVKPPKPESPKKTKKKKRKNGLFARAIEELWDEVEDFFD